MELILSDRLTLDKPRRSADGYMAVHARAARSGIYQYLGIEIDEAGEHFAADQVVNVYRPPDEVFDKASLGSFVGKPITDDHPAEAVTADNWRDLARGTIMGAAKDGEFVGFDLAFMDAATITAIDGGKKELSNGYACSLDVEDGVTPDGTKFQAVQRKIRGNHVALVDAGRAGAQCRVGDALPCAVIPSDQVRALLVDQRTYDDALDRDINAANDANNGAQIVNTKTIIVDGLQVLVTDAAEAAILKLQGQLADAATAKAGFETQIATLTTDKATVDAELATVKTQLTEAQAAHSPAKLRDAAKALTVVSDKAKALGVTVTEDMDEAGIKAAVVNGKLGDAATGWTEAQIDASFAALTSDIKPGAQTPAADPLRSAIAGGIRPIGDAATAINDSRRAFLARKETAYLGAQPDA